MKVEAFCDATLYVAYFGIDENGNQPTCLHTIELVLEDTDIKMVDDVPYNNCEVRCPKCGTLWEAGDLPLEIKQR